MAPALNMALRVQPSTSIHRLANARNSIKAPRVGVSVHASPLAFKLGGLQRKQVLCMSSGKETNSEQQTNNDVNVSSIVYFYI
jgi:hypothetical protein